MSNRKSKFRSVRGALADLLIDEIDIVLVTTPSWSDRPVYSTFVYDEKMRKQKPNNGLEKFFFDKVVVNERTVPHSHYFLWRTILRELPYMYTKEEVLRARGDWIRACGFEEWAESLKEPV